MLQDVENVETTNEENEAARYLREIYLGEGWWNLSRFWDRLEIIGKQRDAQKARYNSTKNWSAGNSTHFLGLLAEMSFSLETGIQLDLILKPEGDSGFDFIYDEKQYDIKGTKYCYDPHLKQYPNPKKWVDYYLLTGIDFPNKKVKIFGWTDKETMMNAKLVNYGHGNQRSLAYNELNPGLPEWLPSLRKKFNII